MRDLQEYKLVPFSEITNEARDIATAWCENYVRMGFDIQQKHKLASDIMNYAAQETADSIQDIDSLTKKIAELMHENERLKEALKTIEYLLSDELYEENASAAYQTASGALKATEKKPTNKADGD